MPRVTNSYGAGNALSTTYDREGLNVPDTDFWGDMEKIIRRMGPGVEGGTAGQQASALRPSLGVNAPAAASAGGGLRGGADGYSGGYEADYGVLTYPHGSAGFYSGYRPGQNLGSGQAPVAMGFRRRSRE